MQELFSILTFTIAVLTVLIKNTLWSIVLFIGLIFLVTGVGLCNGYTVQSIVIFLCYITINVLLVGIFYLRDH